MFFKQLATRESTLWHFLGRGKLLILALWAPFITGAAELAPLSAEAHGVSLSVTPLTRSQGTAFFVARGFAPDQIAAYAHTCGFSFSFENRERTALRFRLADWSAEAGGHVLRFVPSSRWEEEWERLGVTRPARIAFRWAQFPDAHEFARGDWIMGMATLAQRPAGEFRLVARFADGGTTFELPIDNVACAPLD